jgi:hypothetical protein
MPELRTHAFHGRHCATGILAAATLVALLGPAPLFARRQQDQNPAGQPAATPEPTTATSSDESASPNAAEPVEPEAPSQDDRLLFTLPNYLTVENHAPGSLPPLRARDKFRLVAKDSFDIANYPFIGLQAAIAQASNSPPSIKQNFVGYTERYGIAFADNTIGNFMTEAVLPSLLRQDPRYYQRGRGNFFRRFGYTVSRSFVTRGDSGRVEFNYSEISGNAVAAGVSNLYYPGRTFDWSRSVQGWWTQVGWDTAANLLREFWPDLHRMVSRKHQN